MSDINQQFDKIKQQAYRDYKGFDSVFARSNNYQMDLNACTFKHGNCSFKILPVGTAAEHNDPSSFILFGDSHPTGIRSDELDAVVKRLHLPEYFEETEEHSNEGTTGCFKHGFKTAALICNAVKGKAFVSVCPQEGTWVWFVVLRKLNNLADKFLTSVESRKSRLTDQEASDWYDQMKF